MQGHRALFRCDASVEIGAGHVMRCLVLADELQRRGVECHFLSATTNQLTSVVSEHGHRVKFLEGTSGISGCVPRNDDLCELVAYAKGLEPSWIIVDHYQYFLSDFLQLRSVPSTLVVIDDMANRAIECDILLNQNFGILESNYEGLVPEVTKFLLGPEYALVRRDFGDIREASLARDRSVLRKVLVTLGASDTSAPRCKIFEALLACNLGAIGQLLVLGVSPDSPDAAGWVNSFKGKVAFRAWTQDMAREMLESDAIFCAGGSTLWEICTLGIPAFAVKVAENQAQALDALTRIGAIVTADWSSRELLDRADRFVTDTAYRLQLGSNAARLTFGNGASLVANELQNRGVHRWN
jgi:UDP-2,4-diacetamido-2,4,6-trideoxy-beta-L-altropyranose hydrolase